MRGNKDKERITGIPGHTTGPVEKGPFFLRLAPRAADYGRRATPDLTVGTAREYLNRATR